MRGKLSFSRSLLGVTRITPADAGKTKATLNERFVNQDHPRGCGENGIFCPIPISGLGSPPRMRGKHKEIEKMTNATRITPADAGKTAPFSEYVPQ